MSIQINLHCSIHSGFESPHRTKRLWQKAYVGRISMLVFTSGVLEVLDSLSFLLSVLLKRNTILTYFLNHGKKRQIWHFVNIKKSEIFNLSDLVDPIKDSISLTEGIFSTVMDVSTPATVLQLIFSDSGRPLGVGTVNVASTIGKYVVVFVWIPLSSLVMYSGTFSSTVKHQRWNINNEEHLHTGLLHPDKDKNSCDFKFSMSWR